MNMNIDIIKNECKKQGIDRIIKYDEPLKNHTSLRIGGTADIFCNPNNIEDLKKVLSISKEYNIPFWVIGNGTNLLISDSGIRGLVINLNKDFKKIEFFFVMSDILISTLLFNISLIKLIAPDL